MKCPFCGREGTAVKDSRNTDDNSAIRRRRECPECGSHDVEIKCNMFNNLYTCRKCGFQEI